MTTRRNDVTTPPSIRLLPSELIDQIAAGEVVERPASVVKELIENALDAGAREIRIELEAGGRRRIEVIDDGSGMAESDARLCIHRHATSKLRSFDDLSTVRTLGFRGEALPSIASVSRFTLVTWDGEEESATEVRCEPGSDPLVKPAAREKGTTVRVEDLFHNVPARRKFLKSPDAEFRAITTIVTSYALTSHPVAFRVEHNGRTVLDLPSAPDTRERTIQILGREVEDHLEEIDSAWGDCHARGWVTRGLRFGSRRNQYFFVNGRLVRDRVLTHAATRATGAFDFDGHPAIVLLLEIRPDLVDVNVHPAKTEVRFRDSGVVHVAVEGGIRRALAGPSEGAALLSPPPGGTTETVAESSAQGPPETLFTPTAAPVPSDPGFTPLFRTRPVVQPPPERFASPQYGSLEGRVVGQYRDSYIVIETTDGLRLVDQHVAHERILYDSIEQKLSHRPEVQRLIQPFLWETGAAEAGVLESHLEELQAIGFEIERFSGNTFAISATPTILGRDSVASFLRKLIDASLEEKTSHIAQVRHRIVASLACQAAIKVHRPLSGVEMTRLVAELLATSNPYACPHGRPIIVDIRHADIEKHFHRR